MTRQFDVRDSHLILGKCKTVEDLILKIRDENVINGMIIMFDFYKEAIKRGLFGSTEGKVGSRVLEKKLMSLKKTLEKMCGKLEEGVGVEKVREGI